MRAQWQPLQRSLAQVIDMPLLFESGAHRFTRPRVLVACDEQSQQRRLMARGHLTAQQATARMRSQMLLDAKQRLADVVIDNNGSIDATRGQVGSLQMMPTLQGLSAALRS